MNAKKTSLTSYRTIQIETVFDVVAVAHQREKATNAQELERIVTVLGATSEGQEPSLGRNKGTPVGKIP